MVRNQNIADLPRNIFPAFGTRSLLERAVRLTLSPWSSISLSFLDPLMIRFTSLGLMFDCVVLV